MTYEKYLKLSTLFMVLLIIGLILVESFLSMLLVTQVIIPWISGFEISLLGAFNFGMMYAVSLIAVCIGFNYVVLGLYRKHVSKKETKLLNKELGLI
jgi:hypothetical protein